MKQGSVLFSKSKVGASRITQAGGARGGIYLAVKIWKRAFSGQRRSIYKKNFSEHGHLPPLISGEKLEGGEKRLTKRCKVGPPRHVVAEDVPSVVVLLPFIYIYI